MRKTTKTFAAISLFLLATIYLGSCAKDVRQRPPIILIAVESLAVGDVDCTNPASAEEDHSGFGLLCRESIRFTHAFAPSVLSQPSLASIFTALRPIEHGVRDNGESNLSFERRTLAEEAILKGYRTFFVSGGAPVLRQSGLNQGFEIFDDVFSISINRFFRPVGESFSVFLKWIRSEALRLPFFSVIYLPDLLFEDFPTVNDYGETRPKSVQGQIQEVDESLYHLINELKEFRLWDKSYVVLLGLNGRNQLTGKPYLGANLKSDNVHVTMLIKPPRGNRESDISWKVDQNVSLVDLGYTLFEVLGVKPEYKSQFELVSLIRSTGDIPEERLLLVESAWPQWKRKNGIRYSVRQGSMVYMHDQEPKVYNSLTDRYETIPILASDSSVAEFSSRAQGLLNKLEVPMWEGLGAEAPGFIENRNYVNRLIAAKDWKAALQYAESSKDKTLEKIAFVHLGKNKKSKANTKARAKLIPNSMCVDLFLTEQVQARPYLKCQNSLALYLYESLLMTQAGGGLRWSENFINEYRHYLQEIKIAEIDYKLGEVFNINFRRLELGREVDLILELPALREFKLGIQKIKSN